jgi:hypothetical protein
VEGGGLPAHPAPVIDSLASQRVRLWVSGGLALSTFGGWYHNIQEFPGMRLWAPEMLMTIVPALGLLVWWWMRPGATLVLVTAVWALLNLIVGAFLTVLPLPVLPFQPEQSTTSPTSSMQSPRCHRRAPPRRATYQSHLIYAVTQVPLLVVLAWLGGRVRRV